MYCLAYGKICSAKNEKTKTKRQTATLSQNLHHLDNESQDDSEDELAS